MKNLKTSEIRDLFLNFFQSQNHTIVKSSPLLPQNDPTLLFTNSGMVQFKQVFLGEEKRNYTRAVSCQKSVRAGGKHNDLENVGYTSRHHTFFEMLGNFSFGDYFKKEAIGFAWEFLTKALELPVDRLWVTVFRDDDEAEQLWKSVTGISPDRIVRLGEKDNFWAMGDTGPCGPCSEIIFDQGDEVGCKSPNCAVGCDCDRYLEIWNLVFMQFFRDAGGKLNPLPMRCIDTGMGLERIASVCQGHYTNYDTDIFQDIISEISKICGVKYGDNEKSDVAMRVIADHARTAVFLISEGLIPSNEGQGYVLRRIMRRAIRYGRALGLTDIFLSDICDSVINVMGTTYPEIVEAKFLQNIVQSEEKRFSETLNNGLTILESEILRLKSDNQDIIPGDFTFKLYDTYGFPPDIVRDLAIEHGISVDMKGFEREMQAQKERSKGAHKTYIMESAKGFEYPQTDFLGYDRLSAKSEIIAFLEDGSENESVNKGWQGQIITSETPFYGESGGQIGDKGIIKTDTGLAVVNDTKKAGNVFLHVVEILEGSMEKGQKATLEVDTERRNDIMRNHTSTHLLHRALRIVLGDHVKQAGSLVTDERLRFDFSHFQALTKEELNKIEKIVNDEILRNLEVKTSEVAKIDAEKMGAMALFGEKYGDKVRVVRAGDFSMELCGGTHCQRTGDIGLFKIVSESAISAGFRRIEAITGRNAINYVNDIEEILNNLSQSLKCPKNDISTRISKLQDRIKQLEKGGAAQKDIDYEALVNNAETINNVRVIYTEIEGTEPKALRDISDKLRDKLQSGIVVIGTKADDKAHILVAITKDLTSKYNAGNMVKELVKHIGGSGGGRPDFAQAGGANVEGLKQAIEGIKELV